MASKRKQQTAPRGDPAKAPPVDLDDPVEVSSVDSFPASDPPGWITQRARKPPQNQKATDQKAAGQKETRRARSNKD